MFPPYSTELAHHYCLDIISKINDGQFFLKQVAKESLERKNQGVMIGTLVCWNQKKKQRETNENQIAYKIAWWSTPPRKQKQKAGRDRQRLPRVEPLEQQRECEWRCRLRQCE